MTPTGWRLVPVEATKDMLHHRRRFESLYRDMLVAAPGSLKEKQLADRCAIELAMAHHQGRTKHEQARAVIALFRGEGK